MPRRFLFVPAIAICALAGCGGGDDIANYRVERVESAPVAPKEGVPVRFLGAVIPQPDRVWFVKLQGSPEAIEPVKSDFDAFMQSLRFDSAKDPPIVWKLPEKWKDGPASEHRFATLLIESAGKPLELTVTQLGKGNTVVDNVNRWRRQIGLPEVRVGELKKVVQEIDVAGTMIAVVDMTGAQPSGGAPMMPKLPPKVAAKPTEKDLPFEYKAPEGWTRTPKPLPLSVVSFLVEDANGEAKVTVTPLRGTAGGWVANVNRWRGQVQLPSQTEEQMKKDPGTTQIEVSGSKSWYVDLANPKAPPPNRTLAVIVEDKAGDSTWFLLMRRAHDTVGKQKDAFEGFARSFRLGGSKD